MKKKVNRVDYKQAYKNELDMTSKLLLEIGSLRKELDYARGKKLTLGGAIDTEKETEFAGGAKPYDPVNKPRHYNVHPSGVECITVVQHFNFNRGNAIKYIWRAEDKGNPIQDLSKAIQYLKYEIERIKNGKV